jgi:predicted anti-sigma-YlaC factor YlaD
MSLLLTCSQVTNHLTNYLEGATSRTLRWRMRTHLSLCPGCRAFLSSLQALPELVRGALAPAPEPPLEAREALAGALTRLRRDELKPPAPSRHPTDPGTTNSRRP